MKKLIKSVILLVSIVNVIYSYSQTTNDKTSLRYYLQQSKTFIYNSFSGCHITSSTGGLSVSCENSYANNYYSFYTNTDGLVTGVVYMPNNVSDGSIQFSLETSILNKEGWKINTQSTDESGNITYIYKMDSDCVKYIYMPLLGYVIVELCQ